MLISVEYYKYKNAREIINTKLWYIVLWNIAKPQLFIILNKRQFSNCAWINFPDRWYFSTTATMSFS